MISIFVSEGGKSNQVETSTSDEQNRKSFFTKEEIKIRDNNTNLINDNDKVVVTGKTNLVIKFWKLSGDLQKVNSDNFRTFNKKGFAKAAWNFSLENVEENKTRLTTETRVKCLDKTSRDSFRFYWMFVKPFSGWIRREALRLIKQKAEVNS